MVPTISNTLSKFDLREEMSLSFASLEDAASRPGGGKKQAAISNERIHRGEELLNTYVVRSNAIPGGMGNVWKVYHKSWNTELAMKRPQPVFFAEAGERRKQVFIAECEHWINLGLHPNIVTCYYVREIGGVPTIFSEWMNWGDLKSRICDGSLYEGTEKEVQLRILDVAIQAARGLRYSHENHLVHQDVKPENFLLNKFWEVKVADFGMAKAKTLLENVLENEAGADSAAIAAGSARSTGGTLKYCPQEQVEGEEAAEWMDAYALAVTILEMYTGKLLWKTGAEVRTNCGEYFGQTSIPIPASVRDLIRSCVTERISDMKGVEDTLIEAYRSIAQEEGVKIESADQSHPAAAGSDQPQSASESADYPRPAPEKVMDTADSLNNRALSFVDLGKPDIAESIWNKALELSPDHIYCVFNNLINRWYRGKVDDLQVVERLQELDGNKKSQDSREVLQAALKCRGEDKAVKEVNIDQEHPEDWPTEMRAVRRKKSVCIDSARFEKDGAQKRFYNAAGDRMVQVTAAGLRVWDLSGGQCVREIGPVSGSEKISFVYYEEEKQTILLGSTVWHKTPDRSPGVRSIWSNYTGRKDTFFNDPNVKTGIMRLYDMKNGRCIRTLQPGVSMEFAVDENPGGHCFGSAVMAQDGSEYCYPDEGFTCLKYRHPDLDAVPAAYFVSRIVDYDEARKRHAAVRSYKETAKDELRKLNIAKAYDAVSKAYAMLGDEQDEELSLINSELGKFGRISGIRGFRTEPAEDPLSEMVKYREKRDYTLSDYNNNAGLLADNWKRIHITDEGLRKNPILIMPNLHTGSDTNVLRLNEEFFVEQDIVVSPDLSMLFLRGKLHGEISYSLYAADTVTGQILSDGVPISKDARIRCISPDGKKLIVTEYDRLSVYTVQPEWGRRVSLEKNPLGYNAGYRKEICNVCFRPDSRAVYLWAEGEPISMYSLNTGGEYSFYEDESVSSMPSVFSAMRNLRAIDKDSFVCLTPSGNFRFVIDYRYEFPGWTDWDEEARPYLERFLLFHPEWGEEDFYKLLKELQMRGLGFIDSNCIKSKLEEISGSFEKEFARRRKGRLPDMLTELGEVM